MLITEILARNARMYGDEIALVEREPECYRRRELSWQAFHHLASRVAQMLIQLGIKKGDRVILLMTNCIEWLPIYFGILRTGAWAVPLNFRFDALAIRRCAATSGASVVIFGEEFIDRIHTIKSDLAKFVSHLIFLGPDDLKPDYVHSFADVVSGQSPEEPRVDIDIMDEAALYFTSGTTGTPKASLLTHRNLEFACFLENMHHHQTHEDNFLCIPPYDHKIGLDVIISTT